MKKAKSQTKKIVTEVQNLNKYEDINRDNLLKGLDSRGANMPPYVNPDYANFKTQINSNNRGFWDLRLTGEYHKGISTKVENSKLIFYQRFSNDKITWLNTMLAYYDKEPLGITTEQNDAINKRNAVEIREKIINIITK